jgi:lambda family phage tail tape measure protein
MSSIKVALELDDSKYTARLKDATAAAEKFTKTATTGSVGVESSFTKVSGAADNLQSSLAKMASGAEAAAGKASMLVSALSGLAAVAFVQSLLSGASASKDMSEAFGLSVESVLELQAAFGAAGRGPDAMGRALAALGDSAVGALQGNYALRDSFSKLGISMEDLQTKDAKTLIGEIADKMTSGKTSAAELSATYDVLSKAAKGLPWGDLKDKLAAVSGTMGPAAQAAIELDATMKKMEASASAVKREFTLLLEPVAKFFNEMSSSGNGAKLMAEGIAAAMLLMAGSAIISGLSAVGGAVKSLIGWYTGLAAATAAAGSATAISSGLSAGDAAARTIQAVGLGRVGTALVAVNIAQSALNTLQASGIATALELAAADSALALAQSRLAIMSEAATAAQATLTAAQGAGVGTAVSLSVATGTAAVGVSTLGTAMYAVGLRVGAMVAALGAGLTSWAGFTAMASGAGAALLAFLGPVGAIIVAIAALGTAISLAFDLHPLDAMATKLESLIKDTFPSLHAWINNVGDALGMAPTKMALAAESAAARMKRLGVNPNESGGRSNMGSAITPGEGVQVVTQGERGALGVSGAAVGAGVAAANPMAAQEQSLREQMKLLELTNTLQKEKLDLQLKLVGASEADKATQMAAFDVQAKKAQDLLRINGEIAKMQATMSSGAKGEDAGKYGGQLALLQQQRKLIIDNKDDTSVIAGNIITQGNALKDVIFYREMELKATNNVKDLQTAMADLNASEDQRKLNALEKQIALEVQSAQKRAQELKGPGAAPMADPESAAIAEKVRASYAGQVAAQNQLNDATRERNQYLFAQDLTNNAITEAIRMQAEMAKLTQSTDQQKITDLRTQLELQIRSQIVKEQSTLGKGETLSEERQLAIRAEVLKANEDLMISNQGLIDKGREFTTGWTGAFAQYKSDAENAAAQSKQYFTTFTSGVENAFVNFVQTGKLSFKDLANSMIADFARIAAKKAVVGMIGSISGMLGFADGGDPPVGVASIVGERGPELFVPKTAGTIIPNHKLGQQEATPASTTLVTYNIQANDAQSFKAMIARDPSFLYAVTEQGRRSTGR